MPWSFTDNKFYVILYIAQVLCLIQQPICNVIPAIIVNLAAVTLGDDFCIARKLICTVHLYYTLKFEGQKLRSLLLLS